MNPENQVEKALWRKQMFLKYKAELEANETLRQMLERTYPDSRQRFIEDFAQKKVDWEEYGDQHRTWLEREDLQWVERANACLDQILQKKLFDAQCLWRAEQLEIKEVDVTDDFCHWGRNIRACPFIEPITEADLDIYVQYLQSSNFEQDLGFLEDWQDHEDITAAYRSDGEDRNVPEWYEFHNGRTGLGIYMTLPDIRMEKEEVYMKLWRAQHFIEAAKLKKELSKADNPIGPPLPILNYYMDGWMKWFVESFEDKETIAAYHAHAHAMDNSWDDEQLHDSLELLARADRLVPIQGWYDWKEALHRAADSYSRARILEALPEAYEQYRLHIDLGLGFEMQHDRSYGWNDGYRNAILDGREMNGEPRDFNF
jgi:hypothetical protein